MISLLTKIGSTSKGELKITKIQTSSHTQTYIILSSIFKTRLPVQYFIRGNIILTYARIFLIAKPEHILLQDDLRESHVIIRNLLKKMKLKQKKGLVTKKKIRKRHEKQRASLLVFKELVQISKKKINVKKKSIKKMGKKPDT